MNDDEDRADQRAGQRHSARSTSRSLALAQACAELAESPDPDTVFENLEEALRGLYGSARFGLWRRLPDDGFERVHPPSHVSWTAGEVAPGPPRTAIGVWEQVFQSRAQPFVRLPGELAAGFAAADDGEQAGAVMAAPVRGADRLAGSLAVHLMDSEPGREEDAAFACILAEHASARLGRLAVEERERATRDALSALMEARLREHRWFQAAFESARRVASEGDLGQVLDAIVLSAHTHLTLDRAAIYRLLPDEGALQLLVGIEADERLDRSMRIEPLDRVPVPLQRTIAHVRPCFHREHAGADREEEWAPEGSGRGCIAIPLTAQGRVIGAMTAERSAGGEEPIESLAEPLALLADLAAIALTHAWKQHEVVQAEAQKKQFYRDILYAVTNGKLILCDSDEIGEHWCCPCTSREVRHDWDIRDIREAVTHAAQSAGMPADRVEDLCLCASEAATNALKHAGGGEVLIAPTPTSLRIRVQDHGGGIDHFHLPRATLMKGFSTGASMGLGFTLMHELADRLYLHTSGAGTVLILEMELEPVSEAEQLLARLNLGD